MSTKEILKVGKHEVYLHRKCIKNFHLNVLPPEGKIRVSVPMNTSDDTVKFFISTRLPWINKKIDQMRNQDRESVRKFIDGETHYLFGLKYLLFIVSDSTEKVIVRKKKELVINTKKTDSILQKEKLMTSFYKTQLRDVLKGKVLQFSKKMGLSDFDWEIRKMKIRWGSCNQERRKVLFNLELSRVSERYIDYVVVHELTHLIERNHNNQFVSIMEKYLPNWRVLRDELNATKLSNQDWNE